MAEISLQQYYEQIETLIERGRYTEAVAHGKHILQQYPKYVAAYRLLGKAMLEADQDDYAADMFRRVLSADPEDMLAWVALSEVHNKHNELDAAVWHLERAFELSVDNKVVENELRQLYGRRDGVEPKRVQLTRGALARLYLKGDLLSRAISEFRALLAEQPERVDLSVALAEALWRNEQRLEAIEVCQRVLDKLPYCLKANLILGEIWHSSGREEAQVYLQRAEALDPENRMAQELFASASPLPPKEVRILPLVSGPPVEEERPAWMVGIEAAAPLSEREAMLVDIAAALEAQIEIPAWLEEIELGEAPAPAPITFPETPPEEAVPTPAVEIPEWLAGVQEGFFEEAAPAPIVEAAEPVTGWGIAPIVEEEAALGEKKEIPDWLAELRESVAAEGVPAAPSPEEVPDWLAELGAQPVAEAAPSAVPAVEPPPDWLEGLRDQFVAEELAPEAEAASPAAGEVAGEVALPAWLAEGEEMPSGEEALAWLTQLTAGKEEELRALAEAEAEARMAEIMGQPTPAVEVAPPPAPAPAEIPEWLKELAPPEAATMPPPSPPVEEAALTAEALGWAAFGEPEAPPEAIIPPLEEVAPPAEAFGWAAFGEPEAPPAVEAAPPEAIIPPLEEVIPPAEAFGWAAFGEPEAPPAVEVVPPEAIIPPLEEVAPPAEALGWAAFGEPEAPPAVEVAPPEAIIPPLEEVAPLAPRPAPPKPVPPRKPVAPPKAAPARVSTEPFAEEWAYLREHPRDYDAWLALARAMWQSGEQEAALEAYAHIIRAGKLLDSVVPELEEYLVKWPSTTLERVLGDAYMKTGRLEEALNLYRRALEAL